VPIAPEEMKRAFLLLGLLLALSGAVAGTVRASDATPTTTERLQALDGKILTRLNATRAAHGLRPLAVSDGLENAAVAHSRDLIQAGVFQHDSPDGTPFAQRLKHFYSAAGYARWMAGENILYNTADIDAVTAIQAWLNSPPHRHNMLNPAWREVGIGSVHASSAGGTFGGEPTWVITMDFGTRTGGSTAAAKAPVSLKVVAVHKKVTAKKAAKKTSKNVVQAKLKKAKKHDAVHAKRPAAKPQPKTKPVAKQHDKPQAKHKPKAPTPDPSGGVPFEPPATPAPDPSGTLDAAAFGHRPHEGEDPGAGGEELAPVPPPADPPPPAPAS
jgi:uncharacterized protein YkwD